MILKSPPPPASPPVLEKVKYIYKIWLPICRNLPKSERYNLGQKIDGLLVEILETLHRASFSQIQPKITLLGEVLIKVDSLRFFIQLCWELKLLPTNNFTQIGGEVEEVGKMIGGWRKGLLAKTSANTTDN
jgi:hypothetical protein